MTKIKLLHILDAKDESANVMTFKTKASKFKVGNYVKLTISTNPYVPKGTLMLIESIDGIDRAGSYINVRYNNMKYIASINVLELTKSIPKEKVTFT